MDSTWCIPCNKYCFNYERHLRTTLHYKFTLCPKTGPATCNVCGIMCPNMMSHLETDDHIQAFQRVKQKHEEDFIQKFKEKNIISNAKKNEKKIIILKNARFSLIYQWNRNNCDAYPIVRAGQKYLISKLILPLQNI